MLTCFNVQKTHYFSNTVHYCSSSMPRLFQMHCFLQSPSFQQPQSALIGQLAQCIVIGWTTQARVGNVLSVQARKGNSDIHIDNVTCDLRAFCKWTPLYCAIPKRHKNTFTNFYINRSHLVEWSAQLRNLFHLFFDLLTLALSILILFYLCLLCI